MHKAFSTLRPYQNKDFITYMVKFAIAFCLLYFGTLAVIGLSAPEGVYSEFVAKYLDYVQGLRLSLLQASKSLLSFFGYTGYTPDKFILQMSDGTAIKMVYSCVGYGVMSFWGAFIIANKSSWLKKVKWIAIGWIAIWCINVLRITFLLIALSKHWQIPLGLDHHTWFNIAAYILIFVLIYFYDRSSRIKNYTRISKSYK